MKTKKKAVKTPKYVDYLGRPVRKNAKGAIPFSKWKKEHAGFSWK